MAEDPRQLPWAQAADLSARLVAIPIFESPPPTSKSSEVLTRFFTSHGRATVSAELLERYGSAESHVATLSPAEQFELQKPMELLRERVAKVSCTVCGGGKGRECLGNDELQDDLRLTNPGLCIKLVHDLFEDVCKRYARAIDLWGFDGDCEHRQSLQVTLNTRAKPESAYDRPGQEWKICGSTRFEDDSSTRRSTVRLSIAVDVLDWPSLRSAFWILVHEFCCHSLQGRPTADARKPCVPSCPWFEGWMDELAVRLMRADLDARLFDTQMCEFVRKHAGALSQAGGDYRAARYGWLPGATRHKYAAQWEVGLRALEAVDGFLRSFDPDGRRDTIERSLPPLVRLSYRLMSHAPDKDAAGVIAADLLSAPESASRVGTEHEGRLYALLTQPISSFPRWVNELHDLA